MNLAAAPQYDPFASSLTGRRLGRYEVLARLASGGMAGVYVARAIGVAGFERLVAIKVLHPHLAHEQEFISMFLDEARLAARIRHPNVVPTTDISDTQDAGYYLVMDYIEGDHLGALLQAAYKNGQRLPAPISLRIVIDALAGLGAAHQLTDESGRRINLVHRDVSPHNIMVGTDGISRLTDFGVAKAEVRLSTTREGQFKGKLAYMAPEHASSGDTDQRSDLFSMGIILWECLTGRRLFRAENHAATLNLICLEPIPLPSSVDPALAPFDAILAKALERDPDQRFQTAEDFADAVEHNAHLLGGLATARNVGKLARGLAGEKLAKDRDLIQTSIASLTLQSNAEAAAALVATQAPMMVSELDFEELVESEDEAVPAQSLAPVGGSATATTDRPKAPWIAVAIAGVALAGAAAAYFALSGDSNAVTSSAIDEPPANNPSAAAPDAVPTPAEPVAATATEPAATAVAPVAADVVQEQAPVVAQDPTPPADDDVERSDNQLQRRRVPPRATAPTPSPDPVVRPTPTPTPAPTKAAEPAPTPPPRKAPAPADDDLFLNPYRR